MPIYLHQAFNAIGQKRFAIYGRKRKLAHHQNTRRVYENESHCYRLTVTNLVLVTILLAQLRPVQAKNTSSQLILFLRALHWKL
jgi:hypothetical protein